MQSDTNNEKLIQSIDALSALAATSSKEIDHNINVVDGVLSDLMPRLSPEDQGKLADVQQYSSRIFNLMKAGRTQEANALIDKIKTQYGNSSK